MSESTKLHLDEAGKIIKKLSEQSYEFDGYKLFVTNPMLESIKYATTKEELKQFVLIRNILANEEKRLVTVVFKDGTHEIIKCSKEDHFDVNIGVALAIAQHIYGSKNKFHKVVVNKTKTIEKRKENEVCQKKTKK